MGELDGKQIRVGILGSPCIGKSCVVKRFVENTFHGSQYSPTPGVDFFSRRLYLKPIGTVTFVVTDIGANALSSKMLPIYLHGIDIFLLAYDLTNSGTLHELRKWLTIIAAFNGNKSPEPSVALVGSKGDLEHLRAVRLDTHTRFAQEFNIPLSFLVSAKSGESVIACFTKSAVYHLSPDAKQRVRDHAIIQATVPHSQAKRHSMIQNHPMGMPAAPSMGAKPPPNPSAASTEPDPNSTVCSIQ